MVVMIACTCEGLPPHSHTPTATVRHNGHIFDVPLDTVELNPDLEVLDTDPDRIRVWIDWKAVARDLSAIGTTRDDSKEL